MANTKPKINLAFRPKGYFWPLDLKTHVVSSIKGAERKALVEKLFAEGREAEIHPEILQPALTDELRKFSGAIHPSLMGGEYLPDRETEEVEIARITIASTTQDVTCVYAGRGKDRIGYRVVDEYDGDTLSGEADCSSKLPLTLGELTTYFLTAWDLLAVLDMNFEGEGYPRESVYGFFEATSEFYPDFGKLVRHRVEEWLQEKRSSLDEDDE
ncbi:MAG: hypothetical protein O3C34_20910 [Proteobacteria bacterium]|nr:hypothetical protein [Pseudomonadota bacterium]